MSSPNCNVKGSSPYGDQRRLVEPLGYVSPDEFERAYYNRQTASAELAVLT